jgi:ubiquinone/menaquinone biosynthesis C-methylase UbiE
MLVRVPVFPNVKNLSRQEEEKKLMALFKQNLNGSLVVDFGCGTSYYTGKKDVIGCDLDVVLLKKAEVEHKILCDFRFSPIRNNYIDGIVMCHSLEHSNLPQDSLLEAYRILKRGGILAASVPNLLSFQSLYNLIVRQKVLVMGSDHLTAFTPKLFKDLFKACGFRLKKLSGDVLYLPLMQRLGLLRLGFWMANKIPRMANVIIGIAVKD